MWTCEQINYTQLQILENLGYRLLPLWEESIISEALGDMERARRQNERQARKMAKLEMELNMYPTDLGIWDADWDAETCCGRFQVKVMSDGKAIMGVVEQLTPTLTPLDENVTDAGMTHVHPETRKVFDGCRAEERLVLPDKTLEPFPNYVDPFMEGMGTAF